MSLSRRRLLAGLTAVGALGSLAGVGTAAFLTDRESLTGEYRATELELDLSTGDAEDATVPLTFTGLQYGESRTQTVCISLDDAPGWAWIRFCGDGGQLADLLAADLVVDYESGGERVELFAASGPLSAVAAELNDPATDADEGFRLADGGPLSAGDVACLHLTLTVPTTEDEGERSYLRTSPNLTLTVQVHAEQSNNNPTPGAPWVDSCTGGGDPTDPTDPPAGPPGNPGGGPK
jgi:predicted ribosomally synthesized peptide with SipW-like signal peptide